MILASIGVGLMRCISVLSVYRSVNPKERGGRAQSAQIFQRCFHVAAVVDGDQDHDI